MEFPVVNASGKKVSTVELPAEIFEVDVNVGLMHQAYVRQMAHARLGTHHTKSRGEIRATKAKVYRQKGTGRARHGARSAPIFVGGGIAFGPKPRKYTKKMPKKMRQKAIRCALSALVRDEQLVVVKDLKLKDGKTKEARKLVEKLTKGQSTLILLPGKNESIQRGFQNLSNARTLLANYLNIRDLLNYDKVIMPLDALDVIKGIWGQEG